MLNFVPVGTVQSQLMHHLVHNYLSKWVPFQESDFYFKDL